MKTITIRNIPDEVSAFLAGRAATSGRSVNATVVSLLSKAVGLEPSSRKRRDLSWLSGTWAEEEADRFDSAVAECRRIDSEGWQ